MRSLTSGRLANSFIPLTYLTAFELIAMIDYHISKSDSISPRPHFLHKFPELPGAGLRVIFKVSTQDPHQLSNWYIRSS